MLHHPSLFTIRHTNCKTKTNLVKNPGRMQFLETLVGNGPTTLTKIFGKTFTVQLKKIMANVKKKQPRAKIDGVLVQQMISGHETIIGANYDSQFGPVIMVGLGGRLDQGVHAEGLAIRKPLDEP